MLEIEKKEVRYSDQVQCAWQIRASNDLAQSSRFWGSWRLVKTGYILEYKCRKSITPITNNTIPYQYWILLTEATVIEHTMSLSAAGRGRRHGSSLCGANRRKRAWECKKKNHNKKVTNNMNAVYDSYTEVNYQWTQGTKGFATRHCAPFCDGLAIWFMLVTH